MDDEMALPDTAELGTETRIYNVHAFDEATGDESLVGRVSYAPDGRMTVLAALPARKAFLANVARDLNAKEALLVKIPAPNDLEAGLSSRTVERADPAFFDTLQDKLYNLYLLRLREP